MEILNSGSFIPLDNRNKIEQLIFTSKELAGAAIVADGFVNSPAMNQSLALEMWQGAEYVCRAHEEPTIKNIFLSNFLQQLRDLARQQPQQVASPPAIVPIDDRDKEVTPPRSRSSVSDVYLGLVESNEGDAGEAVRSYSEECRPAGEVELTSFYEDGSFSGEIEAAAASAERLAEVPEEPVRSPEPDNKQEDAPLDSRANGSAPRLVESIVLAEKEPYNFDSCTVTAVIHLLPAQGETRKCVISVRTHDFTPQITISEVRGGQFTDDMLKALHASYSQYRSDLPARSADKVKKEKTASKKKSTKPAIAGKQNQGGSDTKGNESATNGSSTVPLAGSIATVEDQVSLFAGS